MVCGSTFSVGVVLFINVGLVEISYFNVLLNLKLYLLSIHKGL